MLWKGDSSVPKDVFMPRGKEPALTFNMRPLPQPGPTRGMTRPCATRRRSRSSRAAATSGCERGSNAVRRQPALSPVLLTSTSVSVATLAAKKLPSACAASSPSELPVR